MLSSNCQKDFTVSVGKRHREMPTSTEKLGRALKEHGREFGVDLRAEDTAQLGRYYELLLKWNSRLHLVAPCSPGDFATRHILESLFLLAHLPQNARVVDVGSGAGLPIIPCLIVRNDLRATLIESSQKKAVFLREALRGLHHHGHHPERGRVIAGRFEDTVVPPADFVTCRALDRFQSLLPRLIDWAPAESELLLFGGANLRRQVEALIPSAMAFTLPRSDRRFLIRARKF
jgi:16S rRNA (guanine527-N7)-methyltransferase